MAMTALTGFAIDGEGTAESPFVITDQGELELVTDFPDCHFVLANDIELEGTWIPLCKQTSSGTFTGVFDGNGHTISNLKTDGSEGGLFKYNKGTIKNVKIKIADEGLTGNAAVASVNESTGLITCCAVDGNISAGSSYTYVGGICGDNRGTISKCNFEGDINNLSDSYSVDVGGICGYNEKDAYIENCYFIGGINSIASDKGGICGWSIMSYGIINCYAVPVFSGGGFGVSRGYSIVNCYFDKIVSGLTVAYWRQGVPLSTTAMKMKQTYSANWDFETVWGMDKNINEGYPYLQWEYADSDLVSGIIISPIEGEGTEESPFLITNQSQIELVSDFPTSHFKMVNDIKIDGTWHPLSDQNSYRFSGVFDGNGHTISNFSTDGSEGGLFCYNDGTIKNVKILMSDDGMVGNAVITSDNNGIISKCSVIGNIAVGKFEYMSVGGICVDNEGTISQCKVVGDIVGFYDTNVYVVEYGIAGAICAWSSDDSRIKDCYFIGEIGVCAPVGSGGICAWSSEKTTILNCYVVSSSAILAYSSDIPILDYCYYETTKINSSSGEMGLPKTSEEMKTKETYSGNWDFDNVWGINSIINDGYPYLLWEYENYESDLEDGTIQIDGEGTVESPFLITNQSQLELVNKFPDSYFILENDIELKGIWNPLCSQNSTGAFSGVFDGKGYTISNLFALGTDGGLFKNNSGTIKNLKIIIADDGLSGNAGIVNYNFADGIISNCSVEGNIIAGNFKYVGGICGENDGVISKCKFDGNIDALYSVTDYVGGICGYNYGNNTAHINNCYFTGKISSEASYKGGICGHNYSNRITNCYSVPDFNSDGYGIAYNSDGNITNSYYDKTVSGLTSTNYGTPKSTTAMKMKQTYSANWDFDTIWGIDKAINNGYPYLLWEYSYVEPEPEAVIVNVPVEQEFVDGVEYPAALYVIQPVGNPSKLGITYVGDNAKYNGHTFLSLADNLTEYTAVKVIGLDAGANGENFEPYVE